MRYYRFENGDQYRLVAEDDATAYDLTASDDRLRSFSDLLAAAGADDRPIDEFATELADETVDVDTSDRVQAPVEPGEVWAAGVTYKISEEARTKESGKPDVYLDVYDSDRPELFFKATPSRTVGHGDSVGIRSDSNWDVPEPELGVVLHRGTPVGYTIGNDMSSRDIEGDNPLYLPQAKVYDRCCSLGPCVASPNTVGDPHDLTMDMTITRDGETMYAGETSTGGMVRTCDELVSYFTRHNCVPELAVLLTGTSLVPDDDFTLREQDVVEISIENIGTLENDVVRV